MVLLITVWSVLSSCDQRETLSSEFTLCIGPKSFQVYRNVMSYLHSKTKKLRRASAESSV